MGLLEWSLVVVANDLQVDALIFGSSIAMHVYPKLNLKLESTEVDTLYALKVTRASGGMIERLMRSSEEYSGWVG
jgi:hypothetical protein